jgi:hypothetical protein
MSQPTPHYLILYVTRGIGGSDSNAISVTATEFQSKELTDAAGELAKREFAGGITNVYWLAAQKRDHRPKTSSRSREALRCSRPP